MLTQAEIDGMRQTSASALPDWCEVTRPVGEPTLNEATGALTPGDSETVYAGPCRVRPRGSQEEDIQVGELHQTLGPYIGTLPGTAALAQQYAPAGSTAEGDPNDIVVDDYLTVTTSSDPAMTGRAFQVRHVGFSAWQIDRRLGLQDREQPGGIEGGS